MIRLVTLCLLVVGLVWLGRVSAPDGASKRANPVRSTPEVIVAFTSPQCGACQLDKPVLRELSKRFVIVEVQAGDFGIALPRYEVHSTAGRYVTFSAREIR